VDKQSETRFGQSDGHKNVRSLFASMQIGLRRNFGAVEDVRRVVALRASQKNRKVSMSDVTNLFDWSVTYTIINED